MLLLLATYAAAGTYGVPVDGFPSADERAVVLWTNAARVAPDDPLCSANALSIGRL